MPRLDGLGFLKEAMRTHPELQCIVVSGYGEFEYAQKAIQYGVTDYLLKPVDREELAASLRRMIDKIENRVNQSSLREQLTSLQESSEQSLREQMLSKLIEHGANDDGAERDERLREMKTRCGQFVAVAFSLEPFKLPHLSFRADDGKLIWFAVRNIISSVLESAGREGVLFQHAMHENELVYVLGCQSVFETETLRREIEVIVGGIGRHLKLTATVGCGSPTKRFETIQQSYQQAKQALRNRIVHGNGRVYMADSEQAKAGLHSVISRDDEALILRALSECNAAKLTPWIDERVRAIATGGQAHFAHLESFCIEFHLMLRKYLLTQTTFPEWMIGELDDTLVWLHGLERWNDMPGHLDAMVRNLIGHLSLLRHSSSYSVIDEVKLYIDQSLHEPISLQTISDKFFFHPSYFSRRFKERFGESFVNYVTAARIRKSEKLLSDPSLKIQEVAELVGYPDAAYFSSVFRKSTGMTPIQFRTAALAESKATP